MNLITKYQQAIKFLQNKKAVDSGLTALQATLFSVENALALKYHRKVIVLKARRDGNKLIVIASVDPSLPYSEYSVYIEASKDASAILEPIFSKLKQKFNTEIQIEWYVPGGPGSTIH